jgi:hypothetical protein
MLEVGTHYGGATLALSRGVADDSDAACIVTLDIIRQNESKLRDVRGLHRITGDSLDRGVIDEACSYFDAPIDLLYVDSRHERLETLQNIAVYANRLQPEVIVLDDIHLNESMDSLWRQILSLDLGQASDVSTLVDRRSAGFGVIECTRPYQWPELNGVQLGAWLAFRRARRALGPRIPAKGKAFLHATASRYRKF